MLELELPSRLHSITVLWLVPNYTTWWTEAPGYEEQLAQSYLIAWTSRELNSWFFNHESNILTTQTPSQLVRQIRVFGQKIQVFLQRCYKCMRSALKHGTCSKDNKKFGCVLQSTGANSSELILIILILILAGDWVRWVVVNPRMFSCCNLTQQHNKSWSQDGAFKRWIRQLHPNNVVAKSVNTLPPLFRHWVFGCGSTEAHGSGGWATTTTTTKADYRSLLTAIQT